MLTAQAIRDAIKNDDIVITPYNESQLNPNSYNVRISNELLVYTDPVLDTMKENHTEKLHIPDSGFVLFPGNLYLASTVESTKTDKFIPCIDGRSSLARLGVSLHVTAGFGDIGFDGNWTLEITVTHPVRIYPFMEIGQVYFYEPYGEINLLYHGKYQKADGVMASKLYTEAHGYVDENS